MRYRSRKADVTHAFTTNDSLGNNFAILIHGCLTRTYALVLRIVWIDIFYWSKNALTEQAVALWFLGAVVNGFRLGNFTVRPVQNIFWAGNAQAYRIKVSNISAICVTFHYAASSSSVSVTTRSAFSSTLVSSSSSAAITVVAGISSSSSMTTNSSPR